MATKEEVYIELQERIILQDYAPGQVLNEKELMAEFKIGRTPLREIFFKLQSEYLVNIVSRYGTFVSHLTMEDFFRIMEMRVPLEVLVIEMICERMPPAYLERFNSYLAEAEELMASCDSSAPDQTLRTLFNLERKAHFTLYEATENPYLIETMKKLQNVCVKFWYTCNLNLPYMQEQFSQFNNLIRYITEHDVEAAKKAIVYNMEDFQVTANGTGKLR